MITTQDMSRICEAPLALGTLKCFAMTKDGIEENVNCIDVIKIYPNHQIASILIFDLRSWSRQLVLHNYK